MFDLSQEHSHNIFQEMSRYILAIISCQFSPLFFSSAPGGDIQSILDDEEVPFEEDVQGFVRQILEALQFIHDKNIAHLDIKVSLHTLCSVHHIQMLHTGLEMIVYKVSISKM